ncbi:GHMP family kinase ATP-binding protein [Clostridium sp. LBM24168]
MEITAFYPGSFGEIIQGIAEDTDILVSLPINVYSKVKLFESNKNTKTNISGWAQKSYIFMQNLLKAWNCEKYYSNLALNINSSIPKGKGMASSTADLCAVYRCMIRMFHKEYNEDELVEQCINVEPTDSIIFGRMTLFDYKTGLYRETLGDYFKFNILVFQGEGIVDTVEFNHDDSKQPIIVDDLIEPLRRAVYDRNLEQLLKVSTESILRNQSRLYYDFLEPVLKICRQAGGLGIIGAHSGNILGIVFSDVEKLKFVEKNICINKLKIYDICTIDKIENCIIERWESF